MTQPVRRRPKDATADPEPAASPALGRKSQRTRRRILDSALSLFAEIGYHAATNARIAESAGLTRGAMLYHFDSREALVAALVPHVQAERMRLLREAAEESPHGPDRTDFAIDAYWRLLSEPAFAAFSELETASRKELDGPILTKAALAWFDKCLGATGHPEAHRAMLSRANVAGVAPALVVTAGHDPLKDEGRDYAERLRAQGVDAKHVEYPHLIHDFFVMAGVSPRVELAVGETAAFLRGVIGG